MDLTSIPANRIRLILEALQGRGDGATRQEIQVKAGLGHLDPQPVRRLLVRMVDQGLLRFQGQTKDRKYFLVQGGGVHEPLSDPIPEDDPPISEEGLASRSLLARPLAGRQPVTYQRAFLDAYRPNATFYLPETVRRHLAELGRSREPERPAGTYARQIFQRLLIDLSWNSSRLEGNTYSLLDTEKLFELGETAAGKNRQETQMILNHKAAIEFLVASAEEIAPDPSTVRNLHALLAENLLANPMDAGSLRAMAVGIHGTTYVPTAVPQLIDECFRQILHTAAEIQDPLEQSFFMLVHLPYLQPFVDGNKRTARLAANIPLIRGNFIPITFMDVPVAAFIDGLLAIYEQTRVALLRDVFVHAYESSCARFGAVRASFGEPDPFRLRYRTEIKAVVREVVLAAESIPEAAHRIRAFAQAQLPKEAWTRFLSVVETELASMHDGNFARFQLRPSEYRAWKARG